MGRPAIGWAIPKTVAEKRINFCLRLCNGFDALDRGDQMQILSEYAPYIAGGVASVVALVGVGFALQKRRSKKRIKADLRYQVSDGSIRRNLELQTSYQDTTELVAELRRVADGLQDEIIQSKTGVPSQQDFNILVSIAAGIVGVIASGGDIEIPLETVPLTDGLDANPLGVDPYDPMPWTDSPYVPRDPMPWDKRDEPTPSRSEPDHNQPEAETTTPAQSVEELVREIRGRVCEYHKERGLGAVMLAKIEPVPEKNFEGGILDLRYDPPSGSVQSHFSRIEQFLSDFGDFVSRRAAGLESGIPDDIERFKQFMNRACTEFHDALPMINAVVDFRRDGGMDDHIKSEFRIYKDLATSNASAKKTQQRLKNHRRLALADSALDAAEHLPVGFGCLVGLTALFYGTALTMRVRLNSELRAKTSG